METRIVMIFIFIEYQYKPIKEHTWLPFMVARR